MPSIQGAYDWAVYYCNKENVGYSQTYRNFQTVNGITYFDCSSFTFFALWLGGGFDIGSLGWPTDLAGYQNRVDGRHNAWTVNSMDRNLPKLGFTLYNAPDVTWKPGDILSKISAHTEICYASPRRTMGAHGTKDRNGNPLPLQAQVSINSGNSSISYYNNCWRYDPDNPPVPPEPPTPIPPHESEPMPLWMMLKPYWKYFNHF